MSVRTASTTWPPRWGGAADDPVDLGVHAASSSAGPPPSAAETLAPPTRRRNSRRVQPFTRASEYRPGPGGYNPAGVARVESEGAGRPRRRAHCAVEPARPGTH